MNKELQVRIKDKKKACRGWKQGQVAWGNAKKLSKQPKVGLEKLKP